MRYKKAIPAPKHRKKKSAPPVFNPGYEISEDQIKKQDLIRIEWTDPTTKTRLAGEYYAAWDGHTYYNFRRGARFFRVEDTYTPQDRENAKHLAI